MLYVYVHMCLYMSVCLCGMCMWKLISDFYITSKLFLSV